MVKVYLPNEAEPFTLDEFSIAMAWNVGLGNVTQIADFFCVDLPEDGATTTISPLPVDKVDQIA